MPNIAVPGTVISSAEYNQNFSVAYSKALNREGGTMTGTLTTRNIVPTTDSLYGIGTNSNRYATAYLDAADVTTLTISTLTCTGCVGPTQLAATAVSAASYGGANSIATFTVDADGRLTAAAGVTPQIPIATGVTGLGANVATALAVNVGSSGAFTTWGSSPTFAALSVTTMNGYTFNQSVASGASPTFSGANFSGIPETAISDGSILARLAANETVTGVWSFDKGSNGNALSVGYSGGARWFFYTEAAAAYLSNTVTGAGQGIYADADEAGLMVGGNIALSAKASGVSWGGGSVISSSNAVAVLADNETVTGAWEFSTSLRIGASAIIYLGADNKEYIQESGGTVFIGANGASAFNVSATAAVGVGTLAWGGGSAISSSNNVALLNASNVFTGADQSIDSATSARMILDRGSPSEGASVLFRVAGSNEWSLGASGASSWSITDTSTGAVLTLTKTTLAATFGGPVNVPGLFSLTGSAANIALGSNYLSGDGGDEGLSIDSSGNATFSANGVFTGTLRADGNRLLGTSIMDSVGTPTCTSGCTMTAGNDYAFRINRTATTGDDSVVTFGGTWTNAPICVVAAENGIVVPNYVLTPTTTTLTITTDEVGGSLNLMILCRGY